MFDIFEILIIYVIGHKQYDITNFNSNFSLGWPKVAVLSLPKTKIVISLLTLVSCYFIPMIISCAIYISLICSKKKKFKNKVAIEKNPFEMVGIVDV